MGISQSCTEVDLECVAIFLRRNVTIAHNNTDQYTNERATLVWKWSPEFPGYWITGNCGHAHVTRAIKDHIAFRVHKHMLTIAKHVHVSMRNMPNLSKLSGPSYLAHTLGVSGIPDPWRT